MVTINLNRYFRFRNSNLLLFRRATFGLRKIIKANRRRRFRLTTFFFEPKHYVPPSQRNKKGPASALTSHHHRPRATPKHAWQGCPKTAHQRQYHPSRPQKQTKRTFPCQTSWEEKNGQKTTLQAAQPLHSSHHSLPRT